MHDKDGGEWSITVRDIEGDCFAVEFLKAFGARVVNKNELLDLFLVNTQLRVKKN